MVEVSTREYAIRNGISQRRVQAAAADGSIPARRLGGRWVIDADVEHRTTAGRPLSRRSVHAVECRLSHRSDWASGLSRSERARVQARITALRADPVPWRTVADWTRAEYVPASGFRATDSDLEELRGDERIVVSGVSDPRSGLSDAGFLEAHVSEQDLPEVQREFLLVRTDDRPNVLLHLDGAPPDERIPLGRLIIELAHHDGARERSAASRLIRQVP